MSSTETGQNSQTQNSGSQQQQASGAVQGASQQQQQIQTTTGNPIHGQQQLQVIQQPIQNSYLQPFYNQNQLQLMPGNILHHGINPQIQVITAGGNRLQNQLSFPTAGASYTIPTSAANNQPFTIIGQLINSQQSLQQQLAAQQGGKPGDMQKVLSPQIGTQLPQGLTWASPFLTTGGNQIFIRGSQPNVDQMFIQQQQPLHNTTSTHQHFSMPLTTNAQIPTTSISQQQQQQGQNQTSTIQNQQITQQQSAQQQQIQAQSQIQSNNNMVSIKTPLQPKPLQIQPNNQQQQNQQHNQQNHITMTQMTQAPTHQIQMLPTTTHQLSQGQSISMTPLSQQATITAQVIQAQQHLQQQQQGGPRHLTILPQQQHQIQPQLIQQVNMNTTTQHQPIRPNISVGLTITSSPATPVNSPTTTNANVNMPTPRGKQPRKVGVGRGGSPQGKQPIYQQRAPSLVANTMQSKSLQNTTISGSTITKVSAAGGNSPLTIQPLKTINLSALQSPPNLPDATLTPLLPQSNSVSITGISHSQSGLRVFPTSTQLPNPNISIVPANMPIMQQTHAQHQNQQIMNQNQNQFNINSNAKKEDSSEMKSEIEKENETEETGNKSKLPKAMVKPNVLTHVLEGFVIQEASEPFPMVKQNGDTSDEPPKKKMLMNGGEMAKCEMCNKVDLKSKFKKNKRFCSSVCVKNMKLQQQNQQNQTQHQVKEDMNAKPNNKNKKWTEGGDGDMTDETSSSVGELEKQEDNEEPKISPYKWSVSDVVDFVRSLPGCAEYADDFAVQEIDGQALVLLKEAHLMSAIGMKLGTALKLCEKIRQAQTQIPK